MTDILYTRGPWQVSPLYLSHGYCANDGSITVMAGTGDDTTPVATVLPSGPVKRGTGHKRTDDAERDANARLIAAGPMMRERIAAAVLQLESGVDPLQVAQQLRSALTP